MSEQDLLASVTLIYPQGEKVTLLELMLDVSASELNYNPVGAFSFTNSTVKLLIKEIIKLKEQLNE